MTPYLIAGGGLVLSVAAAIAAVSRLTGKLEHRVSTVERDTERLRTEKASKESVDGVKVLLERLEIEVRQGFRDVQDALREARREQSGAYPRAPGGK